MTTPITNGNSKQWTTYINTGLLTLIGSILVSVWTNVNDIKKEINKISTEVATMKEVATINNGRVNQLEKSTGDIQSTYFIDIMNWTSDNFVRKPNK